ncbi:hypothetical protein Anas_13192 [Armadillidium nasatum]|uniref:Uncharacterized protein n=1 Tax=Armadillidium nasatum TaxID=96803 RepID=A0A5N5SS19_9CRUS|nr:hypothetical protein Anas_13192 [Armadillidium nasatum]
MANFIKDNWLIFKILSVKVCSESSFKFLDSSKSNSSEMKRQIATTTADVETEHAIITTMKNESSQPNNDSNKIIEEKQMEIQNILTFPGHSFILVLSEEIEEDTKAYNCVLCYQNSYRTDLEGMIQHCKSKEHLLKVVELVNLKDADLGSQKGTSDEIAAVLKGRTNDLDKDGISFATLSTFLSIQKKIYKRIVALRKEKAKTPPSTPAKIKLSADIGANKEARVNDLKVTTCGINPAEKEIPQIRKFAQYPGDTSQGQKQALKRLQTESKTAINITVAKFESDKSSELKNGKRKIEKIVWDEDKITASKSESDTSSEMGKRKRKIVEVDCEEDKVTAATSEAEKSSKTKKIKIISNEDNFKDENSDDVILDLKKRSSLLYLSGDLRKSIG